MLKKSVGKRADLLLSSERRGGRCDSTGRGYTSPETRAHPAAGEAWQNRHVDNQVPHADKLRAAPQARCAQAGRQKQSVGQDTPGEPPTCDYRHGPHWPVTTTSGGRIRRCRDDSRRSRPRLRPLKAQGGRAGTKFVGLSEPSNNTNIGCVNSMRRHVRTHKYTDTQIHKHTIHTHAHASVGGIAV